MPTTIGQLDNVPAPGDPIRSAWAQEISGYVVHPFPTVAARDAVWTSPPAGSLAVTTDTMTYWQYRAAKWRKLAGAQVAYYLNRGSFESSDIGTTEVSAIPPMTCDFEANHLYLVYMNISAIARVATGNNAAVAIAYVGGTVIGNRDSGLMAPNVTYQLDVAIPYRPTVTTAAVAVDMRIVRAWYSVNAIRYIVAPGSDPLAVTVVDLGPS